MSAALQIVDAHQHFWDPGKNYYPWLRDEPMIPFRYGDYSAIRKAYLPADYRKDASGYDVVGSVYVEAEWDPKNPVAEMKYIDALRRAEGLPTVAVAHARLDGPDVESILDQESVFSFVRSIRHKPRANASPADAGAGGMTDALWQRGYAMLRRFGLRLGLVLNPAVVAALLAVMAVVVAGPGAAAYGLFVLAAVTRAIGANLSRYADYPQSHRAARRPLAARS